MTITEPPYPSQPATITYPVRDLLEKMDQKLDRLNDRVEHLERAGEQRKGGDRVKETTSRLVFAIIGASSAIAAIVVGILNLIF